MSIYHYTDLHGLKGIVEGNALWATNINFLNDKNEYIHGFKCFRNTIEYLDEEINGVPVKQLLKQAIENHMDIHENPDNFKSKHVYSISFCREFDQLSQWRGYGNSQGVCLEFDEGELVKGLDSDGLTFLHNDVIYTSETSTVEVNYKIKNLFESIAQSAPDVFDSFINFIRLNSLISSNIPFFKNIGFSEEKEFRLVFSPLLKFPHIKFRVGAYGLIPYLEMKMRGGDKIPIKRIIIGPSKDRELLKNGVYMFLENNNYSGIPIDFSSVPYRS
ncbi:DUF2971 domain-containing protein [Enterobacter kobei]|uniref:DUF2971 domain-containing protein n=1 Tax=Enterobacter cloacae complex TaxID=354276 RepID=UPI000B3CD15E|nr:DUF2971 domain-containing protein [Enterobacter kobei]MBT1799034.1 DUF2971 domain-containing protein [Enterobacter kobei]MBW7696506.1 DUF2971 domain-containing protein [Enterobacter kobei]MBW7772850.1 DUF2971 domain-containing protein [Enterobacter kobei]MCK6863577.1 DUF2971 domain-containing protein [Enterobacter kobei]MCO7419192.1 DUF2971 domain-containing protein [Enterobacter kobei]